jgi:hypothetical protein
MSDDEGFAELIFGIVLGVGVGARAIILVAAIFLMSFRPYLSGDSPTYRSPLADPDQPLTDGQKLIFCLVISVLGGLLVVAALRAFIHAFFAALLEQHWALDFLVWDY